MTPLLLADAAPSEVGQWVMAAAAVLGVVALVLNIIASWKKITRQQSDGERFITHAEFARGERALRSRIRGLGKAVAGLRLDFARQPEAMRQLIDEAYRPLSRSINRIGAAVIAICGKLDIEPPSADDF